MFLERRLRKQAPFFVLEIVFQFYFKGIVIVIKSSLVRKLISFRGWVVDIETNDSKICFERKSFLFLWNLKNSQKDLCSVSPSHSLSADIFRAFVYLFFPLSFSVLRGTTRRINVSFSLLWLIRRHAYRMSERAPHRTDFCFLSKIHTKPVSPDTGRILSRFYTTKNGAAFAAPFSFARVSRSLSK